MTKGTDGVPLVRGVVRSDETRAAEPTSADPASAALVSMIWPIMLLPVSLPSRNGTISGRTLLDLQREGTIIDRGNACKHIQCSRNEKGQVTAAHWQ